MTTYFTLEQIGSLVASLFIAHALGFATGASLRFLKDIAKSFFA